MPPGVPLLIRSWICAAFRMRRLILLVKAGARSPPAPPSPWHPAQVLSNCFCAAANPEAGVCAMPGVTHRAASNTAPAMVFIIAVTPFFLLLAGQARLGWLARRFFQ